MFANYKNRSYRAEMLDGDDISKEQIYRNLRELDFINRTLGGHLITAKGLKKFMSKNPGPLNICDTGCGGGDTIRYLLNHFPQHRYTGIDMNPDIVQYAEKHCHSGKVSFICADYSHVDPSSFDLIISSLFCHHLYEDQLQNFFSWCRNSKLGMLVNDLHRHPVARHSIWTLTRLLNGSEMVKNDAPLSVERGFKKNELRAHLELAGFSDYSISWEWAFRYLVIATNSDHAGV